MKTRTAVGLLLLFSALAMFRPESVRAEAYFDEYPLVPDSPTTDFGIQPLSYPSGVVSATLRRDRILHKALADAGHGFETFPFFRSADMLPLIDDRRLDGGMFGDQATIRAAAQSSIWIVGLVEQVATGIVAKGDTSVRGLDGKRVGYVEGTTAHYVLLQGLASVGLDERRVRLVNLRVDEMPGALERGEIDAFAGWEPATSIALRKDERNRIVFRGSSTDFFVISRAFEQNYPEAARHLTAGLLRAIEWLRRSQRNAETAARWAMTDAETFGKKPERLSVSDVVAITRRNLLGVPSAPVIVQSPGKPLLKDEFEFLKQNNKMPAEARWEHIEQAFAYDGPAVVLGDPQKYRVFSFDYND